MALCVENLHVWYDDAPAVRGISFAVGAGEFFGLLGPNGAGKTTTIRALCGLVTPRAGSIRVSGLDVHAQGLAARARIGLVPQQLAFYPSLSARDNLDFFGRLYGLRAGRLRARVEAVLELTGIANRADHRVATYSHGMQRRLNIAIGLLHEPPVLILDEPTVGVDAQSREAILAGLEQLGRAGTAIVYTTHYMEEAQRLCGRVAVLDAGRILALDTPGALIERFGGGGETASLAQVFLNLTGRSLRDTA